LLEVAVLKDLAVFISYFGGGGGGGGGGGVEKKGGVVFVLFEKI